MINNFNEFKLSDEVLKALEGLEYIKPSKVQERVIPEALLNKDVVVKAQTGSGKTAAFVIPLCENAEWEENEPQALILTPTRELAIQIGEDVKNIGRYKRLKGVTVFGKAPFKDQARELKGKAHMVIGTPGRVLDHIERGTFVTANIKYLVIDEADEMLNMGFIKQVEDVIREMPNNRVTMLFSATLSEEIVRLCDKHMDKPVNIEIQSENLITDKIEHVLYTVNGEDKLNALNDVLIKETPETAVLFCRTKENVEIAYQFLNKKGFSVDKIHGGMLQKNRMSVMESFKKGDFRLLVATDLAARGIDVEGITHVINIDVPLEKEAYVHRIGRTGRAGNQGKAITFATPYEGKYLNDIYGYIGFNIKEERLHSLKVEPLEVRNALDILTSKPARKKDKGAKVSQGIMKIYLNGGKKKKLRAVDFVGTISNIEGVTSDDIGIIEIQDMDHILKF